MHWLLPRKSALLFGAVVSLALAGCATRESAEKAQMSADLADTHAGDARTRADAAQTRADAAHARADEAAGIGNNALGKAQSNEQRVTILEADLKTAHAQIKWLSRNVVYKHPIHRKKHHVVHHTNGATSSPAAPPNSPAHPGT